MITKLEIDAFLSVVQCGSVSAAAECLYITQPALSRRIRSIEEDLSCTLFDRGKGIRGVTLTPQGEAFLPIARKWADLHTEALSVKDVRRKPRLRISAVGSVRSFLLPGMLAEATQDDAPYLINFNLCHSAEAPELVRSGKTDIALVDLARNTNLISNMVLATLVYSVPFALVGGSAWIGRESVRASELNPMREIRLPWDYAFDVWHERRFDEGAGAFVYMDSAASIECVLRDDLFCIVPRTEALRISKARPDVAVVDLVDGPPDENIHCLTSLDDERSERVAYFLDMLQRHVGNMDGIRSFL